ncbi:MAG: flap endonuclease-1 [Nanoarchaeota archaeon]
MGLQISEIIPKQAIEFSELKGKTLAVDASNIIYQFLSTIRQPDGTPLQDSNGKITSHLSGLFYRNISLMSEGIKLVYVFDGKPPELKHGTNKKRSDIKKQAIEKYEKAKAKEDVEEMGKYAKQTVSLTPEIAEESKELLEAMGIQCVQSPGEAEAQASHMANKGLVYAVASQDYDSLLFQATRLIQNLTLARKRKTISGWVSVNPEIIELQKVLNTLQIEQDQLICLGILVGSDYNPGGIKGIGQKKALDIVRKFKYPVKIFESIEEQLMSLPEEKRFDWQKIFELFHKPNVKDVEISSPKIDEDKVRKILIKREFSENRINSALDRLMKAKEEGKQRKLF